MNKNKTVENSKTKQIIFTEEQIKFIKTVMYGFIEFVAPAKPDADSYDTQFRFLLTRDVKKYISKLRKEARKALKNEA